MTEHKEKPLETDINTINEEELLTTTKILKGAIADIDKTLQFISSGKTLIASAITNKGVATNNDDTFIINRMY